MKKFTLMLLAAFMAVVSWAALPARDGVALSLKKGSAGLTLAQKVTLAQKQMVPQKAAAIGLKAPADGKVLQTLRANATSKARKAPRKAGLSDLLTADLMLVSDYYELDEDNNIVDGTPAAGGWAISISLTGANSLAIEGFVSYATESIEATYALVTDPELLGQGVVAIATIANHQTLAESDYGPIQLENALAEADLQAYVFADGTIAIDGLWFDVIGGDGQYAGYMYSGMLYNSVVVAANGTMKFTDIQNSESEYSERVFIFQSQESPKSVRVYNFAGEEGAVTVTMKESGSFIINEQPLFYYNQQYGTFYTTGILISGGSYYLNSLTGVSEGNTLTFDDLWGIYSPTGGSLFGVYNPAVITRTDGVEFLTPVIPDVAATPADPEILNIGNYDAEEGYGSVSFVIPTVDVDGNDLKEDKLFYQLYSDIAGDIQPIVFTPEICEKLTEDMSVIPFTFTDNYDFADRGDYKVVFLNYNFNEAYDRIGVKSIYTGGDETNASAIVWEDVEKAEPVVTSGEFTFDFNAMDVPTSSTVTQDGDITADKTLTEGVVSLTVSPSTTNTPNRFWSTSAGPQLRVYGGTLTFSVPDGSSITKIVFNAGRWNDGNSADSGEFDASTWTGEAQTVVVTIAGNSQLNNIVVTVNGGEAAEDEVVVLPEGVETQEYTLTLSGYSNTGSIANTATKLVAFDGDDVYLQGLAYYFPDAYVKGTRNGEGQYVVKSGQFVGEDEYGKEYLVGVGLDEEDNFVYEDGIVFDFDAETGIISLAKGTYYGESDSKTQADLWDYFDGAVYTPGAFVLPDVVELPEDAEVNSWYLSAIDATDAVVNSEVGVAFVGNDIYVQGLCGYLPEAWVKGTIDSETATATFASGQFYGTYNDTYHLFFTGNDSEDYSVKDVVFSYDAEKGLLTTEDYVSLGADEKGGSIYDYYYGVVISRDRPDSFPVEIPEGLETMTYLFSANVIAADEDAEGPTEYSYQMQVGFDGNDVYFSGMNDNCADMWMKGTLSEDGKTVTIPACQYMGGFSFWSFVFDYFITAQDENGDFADLVLTYDAEAQTFTTNQTVVLNGYKNQWDPYQTFTDVVISKMQDVAATPADPVLEGCNFENEVGYNTIYTTIPTEDVDGNPLLVSKLYYIVWIEKDDKEQPFTFDAGLYSGDFTSDMTEIPYSHDGYDIYRGGEIIYLEESLEELATWTKVGIQSVYYGGGERNASNIVWSDKYTVGIDEVSAKADGKDAVVFDLQGRRVAKAAKGLYIIDGKKVVVK